MRLRQARSDEFIAHSPWKWDVEQTVAVKMANLPLSVDELDAAKTMWRFGHFGQSRHGLPDGVRCAHLPDIGIVGRDRQPSLS